jgi:hypothetical protein
LPSPYTVDASDYKTVTVTVYRPGMLRPVKKTSAVASF